jgi:hypothetical protein
MTSHRDRTAHDYEILEKSRRAAVLTVANLFDGLAQTKKLRRRTEARTHDDRRHADGDDAPDNRDDFLFDMLRLNATYLNETARLGARYRDFGYRLLENIYKVVSPLSRNQTSDELVFAYRSDGKMPSRKLVVQNEIDPEPVTAIIDVPALREPATGQWKAALELTLEGSGLHDHPGGAESRARFRVTVPFGQPLVITLNPKPDAFAHRKYDDQIVITLELSDQRVRVRRVPIVLDGRSYQAPTSGGDSP